jgi:phosphoribosylanthranilate isomerase
MTTEMTEAKICGIMTRDALDAAVSGGASYAGLVFFPKSPRHVSTADAAVLARHAGSRVTVVALTVDADDALLTEIVSTVRPDFLQFHGNESAQRVTTIKRTFGLPIIKAISVAAPEDVDRAKAYLDAADLILFDAKAPADHDRPGGHGRAFDWRMLKSVAGRMPFMLSGGLNPENVAEAIAATNAAAVDVSSGVESAPGVKEPELIRRFLQAVKTAKQA